MSYLKPLLFSSIILAIILFSCKKQNGKEPAPEKPYELANTKWFCSFGKSLGNFNIYDTNCVVVFKPEGLMDVYVDKTYLLPLSNFINFYKSISSLQPDGKGNYNLNNNIFKGVFTLSYLNREYRFEGEMLPEYKAILGQIVNTPNGIFVMHPDYMIVK